ncbi:hypothetical protein K491DRAFT_682865 [Lophiostoma macrostomum CBS 122681]|uniref:F-box domain-containing protein n=1 Tax=Lophiostoma macrostomum CBS 122681 TaxID=1314788 RepID=A0A6A6SSK1_9PLEO|nr:hypothetical protein K491DRAFT_682865 [Lophiostoma macrostomum CBS 122681]
MEPQPFRFMDLPVEIRFLVYEALPRRINHHKVYGNEQPQPSLHCVLVTRVVSLSLIRSCRAIYEESRDVITRVLKNFILINPPTIILNFSTKVPAFLMPLCMKLIHHLRLPQETQELRWDQHITFIAARYGDRLHAKDCPNYSEWADRQLTERGLENVLGKCSFFVRQAARQVFWASSLFWNSSPKSITYYGNVYQNKHIFHIVLCGEPKFWDLICNTGAGIGSGLLMKSMALLLSPLSGRVAMAGTLDAESWEVVDPKRISKALKEQEAREYLGSDIDYGPQMSAKVWEEEWLE